VVNFELEEVKREIGELKQKIVKAEARVEVLENNDARTVEEDKVLEQKRPYLTALLSNLSDLRKKEARLEEGQQQSREPAGTAFVCLFVLFFYLLVAEELGSAMGQLSVNTRRESYSNSSEEERGDFSFFFFSLVHFSRQSGSPLTFRCWSQ